MSQESTWINILYFILLIIIYDVEAVCCYKQECPPYTDLSIVVQISVHVQVIKWGEGATLPSENIRVKQDGE